LSIQLGSAGWKIGESLWQTLREDNGIDDTGYFVPVETPSIEEDYPGWYAASQINHRKKAVLDTFFEEGRLGTFTTRTIMVDTRVGMKGDFDEYRIPPLPDYYIVGTEDSGCNYAKGYYVNGPRLIDQIMATIERRLEQNPYVDGILLFHSVGGGTGSGLGTLLLERLRSSDLSFGALATVTVLPSAKMQENVVEPYNPVLALPKIADLADMCLVVDNEGLCNISRVKLKDTAYKYSTVNPFVGRALADIATLISWVGLSRLIGQLVPFPRINLVSISTARFSTAPSKSVPPKTLMSEAFSADNIFSAIDLSEGGTFARVLQFRGNVNGNDAMQLADNLRGYSPAIFPDWPGGHLAPYFDDLAPSNFGNTLTMLNNHTGIKMVLNRMLILFNKLLAKRIQLQYFLDQGMGSNEFDAAALAMRDLYMAYVDIEQQVIDVDEEEEEEEEDVIVDPPVVPVDPDEEEEEEDF